VTALFGHEAAVAAFRAGYESGQLHHAWLLTGPKGIGKQTFARAAGLWAIAQSSEPKPHGPGVEVDPAHPAAKLIDAEAHPDFIFIERELWKKNDEIVPKHDRSGPDDVGRGIRVLQIRWMNAALAKTTSISKRRIVVIDSVDDLETSAANALLKNLEEPPANTIFFLISHAPERLLPTIRSRCRLVRMRTLADDVMASALRSLLPDAEEDEIAQLVAAGQGAPGRAIAYRGLDIAALDMAMQALVAQGDPANARRAALAQSLNGKAAQPRYEAFLARVPSLIAATARQRNGQALADALALWERASALAGNARRLSLDPQSTVFELAGMLAALAPAPDQRAA
jgi:DNA polymerase-3 subunit delta'